MRLKYLLLGGLISIAAAFAPSAHAQTLWTGTNITFIQNDPASADVLIPGAVSITRGGKDIIYNGITEGGPDDLTSPEDTLWAMNPGGNINNYAALDYVTFGTFKNGDTQASILNKPMVLQLVTEQIYIEIEFTAWGRMGAAGFTYIRSTAPPTPVKLNSPTINGNSFIFSSTNATSGLTYVAQSSSNLTSWVPVATNVAASSTISFTNALTAGARYFRVQSK